MSKTLPKMVGELLAHFQDLTDTVVQAVINRVAESQKDEKHISKIADKFSSITNSYYKKYSEIKADKSKNEK